MELKEISENISMMFQRVERYDQTTSMSFLELNKMMMMMTINRDILIFNYRNIPIQTIYNVNATERIK